MKIILNLLTIILGIFYSTYLVSSPNQVVSIKNTRIFPISVFIKNKFNLCNNSIQVTPTITLNHLCTSKAITLLPGQTFIYTPPPGSAVQGATNITVVVYDFRNNLWLEKQADWGSALEYPYPDFSFVEQNSNRR
jgi:hypothetical protein